MTNKRESIVPNVDTLPKDDVVELYGKLAELYLSVKKDVDQFKQELYNQKSQTKMLTLSQNDLQSELDSINASHKQELDDFAKKSNSAIEALKEKNRELETDKIQLESAMEELSKQLVESQKLSDDLQFELEKRKPTPRYSEETTKFLEAEVEILKQTLFQERSSIIEKNETIKEQRSQLEDLKEKLACLEDNFESKKMELDEKNDTIETLQEKVQEAMMEIAMLKASPEDASELTFIPTVKVFHYLILDRKGNSLFAEVDDQRQKMKTVLQNERSHYLEMKKTCNAKEIEIRRLKRENTNIKQEIQVCSGIMRRGEQIKFEAMNTQITKQQMYIEKLESRLDMSAHQMKDLAAEQKLDWIDSVLSTANEDTSKLRTEQLNLMMQNTSLAENLHKSQKEFARSRLDCVKLKVFLSRLVASNNIKIKDNDLIDIDLDSELLESLKLNELEMMDSVEEPSSSCESDLLNESTIILLGGRERLGNFIPSNVANDVRVEKSCDKENSKTHQKEKTLKSPAKPSPKLLPVKVQTPLRDLQPKSPSREKERSVKFSNVVKTKVIDDTQEQFEQSKQARKRTGLIVKRIKIQSKAPPKKLENV